MLSMEARLLWICTIVDEYVNLGSRNQRLSPERLHGSFIVMCGGTAPAFTGLVSGTGTAIHVTWCH